MKIGTLNLDYWRRVFDDSKNKELYKTKKQIQDYKTSSLKIIKESDLDFLLLQETNPFFYFGEKSTGQWPYEFNCSEKKIYFQNFRGLSWGNAIVANRKYTLIKNSIPRNSSKYYYSKYGQMLFDFSDEDGNIITIINIYNKCKDGKWETYYETLENIIIEIGNVVQNKKNLIVLAGDFNGSVQPTQEFPKGDPTYIDLFEKIKKIGFVNCTEGIGRTISCKDYQDDYIFIKNYNKSIPKSTKHNEDISDHYLVDCEIKL
jgi:hypothetical protein